MTVRCINANAVDGLRGVPSDSIDCVVTSPPYWGLRDYGTGSWDGGDPDCDHSSASMREDRERTGGYLLACPQPTARSFLLITVHAAANAARCCAPTISGLSPIPSRRA